MPLHVFVFPSALPEGISEMADRGSAVRPPVDEVDQELTVEAEAVYGVGAIARVFGDRLPDSSHWKKLFLELAESLEEDGKKLTLNPFMEACPPTKEEERAMTIAYTALWQLREATTDVHGRTHEPPVLFAARVDLRRRLDSLDAGSVVDLTRKERNLLARLAANRMWFWGDEMMEGNSSLSKRQKTVERVARVARLCEAIGWKTKVKRKAGKGRTWPVPTSILGPALDALIEEFRAEHDEVAKGTNRDQEEGSTFEESAHRRDLARINTYLDGLLDLKTKMAEALEGGRS